MWAIVAFNQSLKEHIMNKPGEDFRVSCRDFFDKIKECESYNLCEDVIREKLIPKLEKADYIIGQISSDALAVSYKSWTEVKHK